MNQLFSNVNTKRRYFAFVCILIFLLFFIVFLPMRAQLKKQVLENYNLLAESKLQTLTELINNCSSSAKSVSSRTAIRDYMLDYNDGNLSWIELQEQTYSKYGDGVNVIKNLRLAMRYAFDKPLVTYNLGESNACRYAGLFKHGMPIPIISQTMYLCLAIHPLTISQALFQIPQIADCARSLQRYRVLLAALRFARNGLFVKNSCKYNHRFPPKSK